MKLCDVVWIDRDGGKRFPRLPTIGVCEDCFGYNRVWTKYGELYSPQLAYEVALVKYGMHISEFDNGPPNPPCTCWGELDFERVEALQIIETDTGWQHAGPSHWIRNMEFSRPPNEIDLMLMRACMQESSPGTSKVIRTTFVTHTFYTFYTV